MWRPIRRVGSTRTGAIGGSTPRFLQSVTSLGTVRDRPVCRSVELSDGPVHKLETKPGGRSGGCVSGKLVGYAFPPFAMIDRCLAKVAQDQATLVVSTPTWNTQPWFLRLLSMAIANPILLPPQQDMLSSPQMGSILWW